MSAIIRGTTPTITYTFSTVQLSDITDAILSIKDLTHTITKTLADASQGEQSLSWTLTQADTLSLSGTATMMINYKLVDGTRGASGQSVVHVIENHIKEVI